MDAAETDQLLRERLNAGNAPDVKVLSFVHRGGIVYDKAHRPSPLPVSEDLRGMAWEALVEAATAISGEAAASFIATLPRQSGCSSCGQRNREARLRVWITEQRATVKEKSLASGAGL